MDNNVIKRKVILIFSTISNLLKSEEQGDDFKYRLALDIGTEYVKAAIVKFNSKSSEVIGYGQSKQDYSNMEGGAISDIQEVVKVCHQAIEQAEKMAEVSPGQIAIGIAGEFVKGIVTDVKQKRSFPKRKLKKKEIDSLVSKGQKEALELAQEELLADVGLNNIKVELVNSSVVEMKIDGYKVTNPEQFQGKNLEISIFNTFAPLVHVGALRTVAKRLGYDLVGIIAEPFAIAKSIMSNEAYEFGVIVIDIGGGTTDVALIRNGGIEGTKMFGFAGRDFTKVLARNLNLSLEEAEELKLMYSVGKLDSDIMEKIERILKSNFDLLYEGIEVALKGLASGEALPQKIYLCGGGSALKGLVNGIEERKLYEDLPFFKKPKIKLLKPDDIEGVNDQVGLTEIENVTPKSLALQTTLFQGMNKENLWKKVISNFA
ncbi:cell division FtsA domain-containing protein [Natroniella sulfidigena]|uniref:cell division FtsA domain-containing protein n=1 Tax=Natroniella sulfidigena TaxID=723921 RepID=UPI00200B87A3|nr:cell division FtsA domain-containing protein [Natroniella sulfidigena]